MLFFKYLADFQLFLFSWQSLEDHESSSNLHASCGPRSNFSWALVEDKRAKLWLSILHPKFTILEINSTMISRYANITYHQITVLTSTYSEKTFKIWHVRFWMKNVHHSRSLDIQGQRLENHVITVKLWQIDQAVLFTIIHKHVWQLWLAKLTLELSPVYTRIMHCFLSIFFCFQPIFKAFEVDKLHAAPTLTHLEKRIVFTVVIHPANSALRRMVWHNTYKVITNLWVKINHTVIIAFQIADFIQLFHKCHLIIRYI